MTRDVVAWLILILPLRPLSTRETVPTETCAASAISARVTADRESISCPSLIHLINGEHVHHPTPLSVSRDGRRHVCPQPAPVAAPMPRNALPLSSLSTAGHCSGVPQESAAEREDHLGIQPFPSELRRAQQRDHHAGESSHSRDASTS